MILKIGGYIMSKFVIVLRNVMRVLDQVFGWVEIVLMFVEQCCQFVDSVTRLLLVICILIRITKLL